MMSCYICVNHSSEKFLLYFDTSAFLKEFVDEVGSDLVSKITSSTNRNDIQIISSVWVINEAISVIDRLTRRNMDKKPKDIILDIPSIQLIISTVVERIKKTSENSFFRFVYLEHPIITDSRILIKDFHLSPNDAVHVFTGYVYDCNYFLVQDKNLIKEFPEKRYYKMKLIDLANAEDRKFLESTLKI